MSVLGTRDIGFHEGRERRAGERVVQQFCLRGMDFEKSLLTVLHKSLYLFNFE